MNFVETPYPGLYLILSFVLKVTSLSIESALVSVNKEFATVIEEDALFGIVLAFIDLHAPLA